MRLPSTIIVLPLTVVQVADFGLAEWLQHSGKTEVQLVTNRCWVAPEVLEHQFGPFNISRASEVYMFGMLMYEALTGKWPYEDQLETLAESQPQRRQVVCASPSFAAEARLWWLT